MGMFPCVIISRSDMWSNCFIPFLECADSSFDTYFRTVLSVTVSHLTCVQKQGNVPTNIFYFGDK